MRNPLYGEVITIICHNFMLFIGVPVVANDFTLQDRRDDMGQG